ncbi:hypothetical protein PTTG_04367 [Puccinia triticina 1-1 BBBD Race 1]|uniref:Uncharacterized protein n=1 Tax=Puccinia triticina (isolate 1-1 / race 1 (BBBD)) TaxID=630390 RepID=A0A180G2I2_PUCT1|nr:hypothetical protein PTTG_04367 [Puccinia triticina 1-1 BBBD Race 1]
MDDHPTPTTLGHAAQTPDEKRAPADGRLSPGTATGLKPLLLNGSFSPLLSSTPELAAASFDPPRNPASRPGSSSPSLGGTPGPGRRFHGRQSSRASSRRSSSLDSDDSLAGHAPPARSFSADDAAPIRPKRSSISYSKVPHPADFRAPQPLFADPQDCGLHLHHPADNAAFDTVIDRFISDLVSCAHALGIQDELIGTDLFQP